MERNEIENRNRNKWFPKWQYDFFKAYCESQGKVPVIGHYKGDVWVPAHCRTQSYKGVEKMKEMKRNEKKERSNTKDQ
jgi:hypothetical protein